MKINLQAKPSQVDGNLNDYLNTDLYALDKNTGEPEIIKAFDGITTSKMKRILKNCNWCQSLHTTYTGALDDIKYVCSKDDFNEIKFSWYLPFLIRWIKENKNLYILKNHGTARQELVTGKLCGLCFNDKMCWKLKIRYSDNKLVSIKAVKLGNTVFFDEDNAKRKLNVNCR